MEEEIKIGDKVIHLEVSCSKCSPIGSTITRIREDYRHVTLYEVYNIGDVERDEFITKEQAMSMLRITVERREEKRNGL